MNAPKKISQKCCFCEQKIEGESFPDYVKKLKPRVACRRCCYNYTVACNQFGNWQPASLTIPAINTNSLTKDGRDKLRDNLAFCACSHKATRHVDDGQSNLLHCRDCSCDHFWYAVPQTRNTDLVVLQAAAISAEPTVLDKLRAITPERGATKDEVIVAQQKIIAMMEREAA